MEATLQRLFFRLMLCQPLAHNAVEEAADADLLGARSLPQTLPEVRVEAPAVDFSFAHALSCSARPRRTQAKPPASARAQKSPRLRNGTPQTDGAQKGMRENPYKPLEHFPRVTCRHHQRHPGAASARQGARGNRPGPMHLKAARASHFCC